MRFRSVRPSGFALAALVVLPGLVSLVSLAGCSGTITGSGDPPSAEGVDSGGGGGDPRSDVGGAVDAASDGGTPSDAGDPSSDAGAPGGDGGEPVDTATPGSIGERRVIAYFAAWGVYGRNFHVADVDPSLITHLNYAFANISDAGECVLGDSYADIDKAYPGDTWDPGVLRGSFHQLQLLKAKAPKLKTLLSIGGWTWSTNFSSAAASDASRAKFASSCAELALKYGFDGVDVDWEYPTGGGLAAGKPEDKANYTLLLAALRKELDARGAASGGAHYLLTIAVPAGPSHIANIEAEKIHGYVDSLNIMTYDFHGGFESTTGHNSPLFAPKGDPGPAGFDTDDAVKAYVAAGVPEAKIVVGGAFYGRGWSGVASANDGLFQPATGMPMGTWESGVFDWHDLAANYVPTMTRHFDDSAKAPWLYDASKQIMISYDDAESLAIRGKYVKDGGLGGVMVWELSGDDKARTLGRALWASLH